MTKHPRKFTTAAILLALSTAPLFGAGFQLAERSVSGLGRAFSGEAAIGDDASVLASNAAGLILLDDNAISVGLQYINPHVEVQGTTPSGAVKDNNIADDAFVPYFYYARRINDKISAGLGIYSSFGLATSYSKSFASLAGTETSEITTVSVNPSLAFRLSEKWTLGVGFTAMYVEGRLTALNTFADGVPGAVGSRLFDLEGDDWGYGWNLGILFEVSDRTRIGLQYKSTIDLEIEGSASGGLVALTGVAERDATLSVELPDSAELSIYHELNDQWAIHSDITWTGWSTFQQLAPKVHPGIDGQLLVQENWKDSYRYALGATYKHSDRLTIRTGLALDESPVSSTSDRTLRIPDGDRVWASIGATIKINEYYNLDIAYSHVFGDDMTIRGNESQFTGIAGGDVDLFGIGISGSF